MNTELLSLIDHEGWRIVETDILNPVTGDTNREERIEAYGELFPVTHPFAIHGKLYRTLQPGERKYLHFKSMHDYMWPHTVWHYWTERRFREHCEGWEFITYAGGAATTKSFDAAKIGLLFWLANPKERAVVVASTSLDSLGTRIWGYVIAHLRKCNMFLPVKQLGGQSPKVIYDYKFEGLKTDDRIHGMFAVAAKTGDDEKVIAPWIGRHPDDALMVILDEATDMPPALMKSLPNLKKGINFFQAMAIGNSNSKFDLHGGLSTPKDGWEKVDPNVDNKWETTQENGICLFFSCYESPAIHETDPERKAILSKFLITEEQIKKDEMLYGKDSDSFWRFTIGFWRSEDTDETVISMKFIKDFQVFRKSEWSGIYPLNVVGGLDPAFSTGGDGCILRLAILGVDSQGQVVLDFREDSLIFPIKIRALHDKSADLQIAEQVSRILLESDVPLNHLAIDASGQGRALGSVLKLYMGSLVPPLSVFSARNSAVGHKDTFDLIIKDAYELWFDFRKYIQNFQIRGLDHKAASQLTTRLVIKKGSKQTLETKRDYKARMSTISPAMAHSPDEADAASLCLQSAIINFGFSPGQTREIDINRSMVDDKYSVFRALRTGQQLQETRRAGPPLPSCSTDITSLVLNKDRLSNF